MSLIINPRLWFDILLVGMLDLKDFADRVREVNDIRVGVASGDDQMHLLRFPLDQIQHLWQIDQLELQCVVDFIENDDFVVAAGDLLPGQLYGRLGAGTMLSMTVGVALDAAEAHAGGNRARAGRSACPHCGVAVIAVAGKAVPIGSRRKATQWVWLFFWLMVAGLLWPLFSEGNNAPAPFLLTGGLFGWIGALIYRWLNT